MKKIKNFQSFVNENEQINENDPITGLTDATTLYTIAVVLSGIVTLYNADQIVNILKAGGKKAKKLLNMAKSEVGK